MTSADIDHICLEWWTGLTAEGQPAEHSEWPYRAQGTLPKVEQLGATLATHAIDAYAVRASLARGADGETDVRVEIERPSEPLLVHRWRPAEGSLDAGALWGGRTLARQRSPEGRAAFDEAVTASRSDPSSMELDGVRDATHVLKTRRAQLREQLEGIQLAAGDTASVTAELAEITTKLSALFTRNVTLNEERRAELLGGGGRG